jgi:cytochrome c
MIATYPNGAVPNNSVDDLAKWIMDPPSLKPGTAMPKLGLSADESAAAAAYLYSIPAQ